MTNSKNKWMYGILILSVFALITSASYALWQMTLQQTTTNVITTGCFKIEFQDNNPIQMEKSYPISDEEGNILTPYTFTITNTCESYATYQINLELLDTTTLENLDYINVRLNEKRKQSIGSLEEVTTTIQNAKSARKLEIGYLNHLESKTFTMQMWMDENTPANEEVMNKVLESKITVNTSVLTKSPTYAEVITNCSNNGYKTVDCMLENSTYEKEDLMLDETIDNNLRYIGSNPNNYVTFNNELWQIIGVMNNVEDENGKKDSRIKLIRTEAIGIYSWDSSASNVNGGMGVNEWSQADLMKLLNPGYESESVGGSLYWNRENGTCYKGKNNAITTCNFSSMGINENSKQFIDNVIWNTGTSGSANYQKLNAKELFAYEKSSNIRTVFLCHNNTIRMVESEQCLFSCALYSLFFP